MPVASVRSNVSKFRGVLAGGVLELLDWHDAVMRYAGAAQYVLGGGNHGWEDIDDEISSILRFAGVAAIP